MEKMRGNQLYIDYDLFNNYIYVYLYGGTYEAE